jgi:hypothetical protein
VGDRVAIEVCDCAELTDISQEKGVCAARSAKWATASEASQLELIADAHCPNMKFAAALGRDGTLVAQYKLPADL